MYNAAEIAGFIGAAAWLPQIAKWAYKFFSKTEIVIIPDKNPEIGFTTFGPIFNIRLVISSNSSDVLLNSFEVQLSHESGDVKFFKWQGTKETFSQVRDQTGARQIVEKDENAIAIKVRGDMLADKFFRFQDECFHKTIEPKLQSVERKQNYLASRKNEYHDELLDSEEIHELLATLKSEFVWRKGKYTVKFFAKGVSEQIRILDMDYTFILNEKNIEDLQKNTQLFDRHIEWAIKKDKDEFTIPEPIFFWVSPILKRLV